MRTFRELVDDLVRKPPLLFPLAALAHLFWLAWTIWSDRMEPFPDLVWLQVLWLAGYTFFWLWACDMRRKGALGYIALTVINLSLFLGVRNHMISDMYVSNLFSVDVLFSLGLLFYYKKLR